MTDVLLGGALDHEDDGDDIDLSEVDTPVGDVVVCGHIDGDVVCGYTGTAAQVRMHRMGKHRDRSKDAPPKPRADKKPTRRKPAAKKAADTAAAPRGDRSTMYAASLAMGASAAYLFLPPFDVYDLNVCNAGIPNLANALDACGSQNDTFRRTCDLILGGGGGAAYLQLVMAVAGIAIPIVAHHSDAFPAAAGAKFGEFVGVSPEPEPVVHDADETPPEPGKRGTPTIDDVMWVMTGTPETVMTDAMTRMMSGVGPTVVTIPDFAGATADGDRGSEQPNPERTIPIP